MTVGGAHWAVYSFPLAAGHKYDVVLEDDNNSIFARYVRFGHYRYGQDAWDTVIATAKLYVTGDFASFYPATDDTFDMGWQGWGGPFMIYDLLPKPQR